MALFFSLLAANLKPTTILGDPARPRLYPSSLTFISTTSTSHHKKVGRALCSNGTPTPTKKKATTHKRRKPPPPKPKTKTKPKPIPPFFSDGKDALEDRPICPGCGVFMQDKDPNHPGYYHKREEKKPTEDDEDDDGSLSISDLDEDVIIEDDEEEPLEEDDEEDEHDEVELEEEDDDEEEEEEDIDWDSVEVVEEGKSGGKKIDFDIDDFFDEEDEERRWRKELDGFGPAGVGYGSVTEETLKGIQKEKLSKSERRKRAREEARKAAEDDDGPVVCARCHSLRHHGQVKNQRADNLIPDFDFDRLVVASLMKPASTSPVVVIVVDCVDFDGSFPKNAVKSLFKTLDAAGGKGRYAKLSTSPKLVLVAAKVDLLPSQVSPARLDRWVRNRAKAWGAPKLSGVYLVSAHRDLGVRNLLAFVKKVSGPRSNVWVIGAQNAGKSTLINAFAKKEGVPASRLTEAAVPGTTLGIIRIGNVLPAKAKMYDTPGLLHPYLMSMRLNREEQKMVEMRKELQPRSFRVKAGQTVHLGGLARLDVTQTSVETIYVTVWASQSVSLHLGKTENADEIWNAHVGVRLQPPMGQDRLSELGRWREKKMKVKGASWEVNSLDIAISGLGWFSLGLKGEATVVLWTFDGVEITKRDPLVLDRAQFLERPGFLLPNAISDAIGSQSKRAADAKKAQPGDFLLEV